MKLNKKSIIVIFLAALFLVLLFPFFIHADKALAYTPGEPSAVTNMLAGKIERGAWIKDLYKFFLGFTNIILFAVLVFAALANILNINIDAYGVKKILPRIIFVAVAANLALAAFVLASRIVDSLQILTIFQPRGAWSSLNYLTRDVTPTSLLGYGPDSTFGIGLIIFLIGVALMGGFSFCAASIGCAIFAVGLIAVFLLNLILAVRPYVVFLCAATAPLAIALSILPQTQALFKRWLGIALTWMFLPLLVYAILYIGDQIPRMGVGTTLMSDGWAAGTVSMIVGFLIPFLLRMGLLLLAIRIPFMLEKDISKLVAISGKFLGTQAAHLPAKVGSLNPSYNQTIRGWSRLAINKEDKPYVKVLKGTGRRLASAATKGSNIINRPGSSAAEAVSFRAKKELRDLDEQLKTEGLSPEKIKELEAKKAAIQKELAKWDKWVVSPVYLPFIPQIIKDTKAKAAEKRMESAFEYGASSPYHFDQARRDGFLQEGWKERLLNMTPEQQERVMEGNLPQYLQDEIWKNAASATDTSGMRKVFELNQEGLQNYIRLAQSAEKEGLAVDLGSLLEQMNQQIADIEQSDPQDSPEKAQKIWVAMQGFTGDFDKLVKEAGTDKSKIFPDVPEPGYRSKLIKNFVQYIATTPSSSERLHARLALGADPDGFAGLVTAARAFMSRAAMTRPMLGLDLISGRQDAAGREKIRNSLTRFRGASSGEVQGGASGLPRSEMIDRGDRAILNALERVRLAVSQNPRNPLAALEIGRAEILKADLGDFASPALASAGLRLQQESQRALGEITSHLTSKVGKEEASALTDSLRSTNGVSDGGILSRFPDDQHLAELTHQYRGAKLLEASLRNNTPIGGEENVRPVFAYARPLHRYLKEIEPPQQRVTEAQELMRVCDTLDDMETNLGKSRTNGESIPLDEYAGAREKLTKCTGVILPDDSPSFTHARQTKQALEAVFDRDKNGQPIIVEDPAEVEVRTALQIKRDVAVEKSGSILDEIRRATLKPPEHQTAILKTQHQQISQEIEAAVEPHMNLRFGEAWRSLPTDQKKQVTSQAAKVMEAIATGNETITAQETQNLDIEPQVAVRNMVTTTKRSSEQASLQGDYSKFVPALSEEIFRSHQTRQSRVNPVPPPTRNTGNTP